MWGRQAQNYFAHVARLGATLAVQGLRVLVVVDEVATLA